MPIGLYFLGPADAVAPGEIAAIRLPAAVAEFAASRRYLPRGIPLLKRVAAASGDRVCAAGEAIFINGRPVALRRRADERGRPLPWWGGCRWLDEHEVFLLASDVPGSFDGRYFGTSEESRVIGRARPLWVR
jgi:conjugative transfer signal peptidase TraF